MIGQEQGFVVHSYAQQAAEENTTCFVNSLAGFAIKVCFRHVVCWADDDRKRYRGNSL
jgi:hypothetical protein